MTVPFAADYPFLDVLWSMLIFMAFILWIWLAIECFADIFRRGDTSGFLKALWVIVIILAPYLGVLAYLIVNHRRIAERHAKDVQQEQERYDQLMRERPAGPRGPAAEIEQARGLLESGTINEAEFERLKAESARRLIRAARGARYRFAWKAAARAPCASRLVRAGERSSAWAGVGPWGRSAVSLGRRRKPVAAPFPPQAFVAGERFRPQHRVGPATGWLTASAACVIVPFRETRRR